MGLYKHQVGEDSLAIEHVIESVRLFSEQKDIENPLFGHTLLGHAYTALGAYDRAKDEYEIAEAKRASLIRSRWFLDTLAGQARLALLLGEPVEALSYIEKILIDIESGSLDGTLEPYRIYLTCYQVLRANQDLRAEGILTESYNLIQERAKNISDESLRNSFLENVAVNREIIKEYEKL